jgi:hypothetical protein
MVPSQFPLNPAFIFLLLTTLTNFLYLDSLISIWNYVRSFILPRSRWRHSSSSSGVTGVSWGPGSMSWKEISFCRLKLLSTDLDFKPTVSHDIFKGHLERLQ